MRRIAALALAALVSLPIVSPVAAADPLATAEPSAPTEPSAAPEPTAPAEPTPSVEPTPAAEPTPGPGGDPTPPAEPTSAPDPEPLVAPSDSTAQPAKTKPSKEAAVDAQGRPIAAGRYIVVLAETANTTNVLTRHRQRQGTKAERSFKHAFRGFTATLDATQRRALLADPNVKAVVPDEVIQIAAQTTPTGVSRVGTLQSRLANVNGVDDRVDADVAIVDTGIALHPDLAVAGGYNCSSADRTRWIDENGHGTHVAGTVGARDNTFGVVGVAPGVRLWAVRILNANGSGLLSWYVCGLDWILAQRDPNDSSRPLFEAVNMSVAKTGRDDPNCGFGNSDILHQAICRLYAGGITVVAAAANERRSASGYVPAAYNQVITVSALADTDGRSGGLGGNRCYSWGSYDRDDTFADFSNYGSDIDIIAPGKCIWSTKPGPTYGYSSGTSMAAPAVTGAVALYKATRPSATPAEVRESLRYLGNQGWKTSTDPDPYNEPLLGVSRIGALGTFSLSSPGAGTITSKGGTVFVPVAVTRSSTFFERVRLTVSGVPSGWAATMAAPSLYGWTATSTSVKVTVPATATPGTYQMQVTGTNWGRTKSATVTVEVASDLPTAKAPVVSVLSGTSLGRSSAGVMSVTLRTAWSAATDPSDRIVRYEIERSFNGGTWGATRATTASVRSMSWAGLAFGASHRFRVRALDSDGDWSPWAVSGVAVTPALVSDRSTLITYGGTWSRYATTSATNGGITSSSYAGATARYRFTGRTIAVVAPTSLTRGRATIYLDGVYKATIDLRTSSTIPRRVVYVANWSGSGTHTITIRVAGTAGRPTVSLDGFVVLQ